MHILLGQFYSSQPTPAYDKIAAGLRQLGHTVWLGTPNQEGEVLWHDGQAVVARQAFDSPRWLKRGPLPASIARRAEAIIQLREMRRFIRRVRPDIVQINVANILRWLPAFMPGSTRYVLDVRQTNDVHGSGVIGRARSRFLNNSRGLYSRLLFDKTTFLHTAGAEHVLGPRWTRWATVVPMGVDAEFISARPNPLNVARRDEGKLRFIYVGRLVRRRLLERLLDAAAIVKRRSDAFELVFMGYDATEGYYQQYANEIGVDCVVRFLPPVPYEHVPDVVLRHDVALAYVPEQPADWQYHPTLKVLEYRALGMPIIATDFLPNRELVKDGVNGLLTENTPQSIATAMLRFISEPEFLDDCRRHAQTDRTGTTWSDVATQYERLYQELLSRDNTRQPAVI